MMPPRDNQAFTLGEILVTIAVIGILAMLIYGGARAAVEKSKEISCLAKLRAMGPAVALYIAEHNGALPWGIKNNVVPKLQPPFNNTWAVAIAPYITGTTVTHENVEQVANKHFRCPSDEAFNGTVDSGWSYGWNQAPGGDPSNVNFPPTRITQWRKPSEVIIIGDTHHQRSNTYNFGFLYQDASPNTLQGGYLEGQPFRHPRLSRPHTAETVFDDIPRRNLLYLDGHVAKGHVRLEDSHPAKLRERGVLEPE